jgi:ATP-dependent helicase Lhr and Lhr-like helicase
LAQQILSIVTERGGARAEDLFELLVHRGAFRNVDQPFFVGLLRSLGAADLIDQTPAGEIILGLTGERIVRSLDFYAAFKTTEEFTVLCEGRRIGSVGLPPSSSIDQFLILAGKRWRVLEVNLDRHLILVAPAQGGRVPHWGGGLPDIHPRIRQEMRRVLLSESVPVYLDSQGQEMLQAARQVARNAGLERRYLVSDGPDVFFFSWTGTRIQRTLLTYVNCNTGIHARDEGIALAFEKTSEAAVHRALELFVQQPPTPEALAARVTNKSQEKYEPFLSEDLKSIVFGRNCLDVEGAGSLLRPLFGDVANRHTESGSAG